MKNDSDLQILKLIKSLYTNQKIVVGDKKFSPTKGSQQGSVLSPLIFNLYLDNLIEQNPFLKDLATQGKLLAYADDMLLILDSKDETEKAIQNLHQLSDFGLQLNTWKTQIMTYNQELAVCSEINGNKTTDHINYLSLKFFCDRQKTLNRAKEKAKQFMNYL